MTTPLRPVVLEGRSVRLEPLSRDHLDDLAAVAFEPELWTWTTMAIRTAEDLAAYVDRALDAQRSGAALPFATIARETGRAVGSTRFAEYDAEHRRIEIGWTWLGRAWQRTALNTEAKLLMLTHAFESLGCHRVELKTDVLNEQSRAAIRRLGAREEGIFRKHFVTASGRVRDSVWYSILDDEWPAVKLRIVERLSR